MGKTITVPLANVGESLCYRCRYWDWGIAMTVPRTWEHVCNSPIEHLVPGDDVTECEGATS
jgi:hypothetical protein